MADALWSRKINTNTCHTSVTKGRLRAARNRVVSALIRIVLRENRDARNPAAGETATYATILMARALPNTWPARSPARSYASRPRATVANPVPRSATICAVYNRR